MQLFCAAQYSHVSYLYRYGHIDRIVLFSIIRTVCNAVVFMEQSRYRTQPFIYLGFSMHRLCISVICLIGLNRSLCHVVRLQFVV